LNFFFELITKFLLRDVEFLGMIKTHFLC
jgi:hypothetical protein